MVERLRGLGFSDEDVRVLADHFLDAEARGKRGHGHRPCRLARALPDLDPSARPKRPFAEPGYERWEGDGALGYLTLAAICDAQLADPPARARVIVAADCFPTGMLGYWVRRLAEGGLVAALTATSPPRLAHPDGSEPLVGTTPLAIGIPSSDGKPLVADVSMGAVTHGDVIAGLASPDDLVPFGGDQAYKAFALAAGLQLLVDALAPGTYGALLVVARPEADPVPAFRRGRGRPQASRRLLDVGEQRREVLVLLGVLAEVGAKLERLPEVPDGVVPPSALRLEAGEVVEARRALSELADPFLHDRDRLVVTALVGERRRLEGPFPARRSERLVRPAADREHERALFRGVGHAHDLGIGQVDERAGGRVDRLLAERESRAAADDDVDLLVTGALVVLLDDDVADLLGRVRVDAEGLDPEPAPDRPPLEAVPDG